MESRLSIIALLGAAFALSVSCYLGSSSYLLFCATLIMLLALFLLLRSSIRDQSISWSHIHSIACVYVAWLAVSVYLSTLPGNSILFFWLLASFPIVLILSSGFSLAEWQKVFALFLIAGVISAVWGIAEFWVTGKRANGPLIDPNSWCAINNLFFFGVFANYLKAPRYRLIYLLLLFIFCTASFVAYSRVGTLIFGAALMFVACVLFWRPEFRKQVLTVCALVGISATAVYGSASLSEASSHSEGYTLDMEVQGWSQRFSMWRAAYELYEEHPVAGAGLGTFKVHYPRFRTADDMTNSGNFVHNDYVQFLSEGGPLMLLLLLLLVGYLCVKLWVNVVSTVQTGDGAARVLLITAMGTTLVHSLMNFTLYQLSVQMLFGLYMVRLFESEVTLLKFTRPRLLMGGGIVAGLYFSAVIVLDTISSGIVYDNDQFPFAKELKADQQTYFNSITLLRVLRPNTASNHFALATLYRTAMDKQSDPEKKYALAIASAFSYQRGLELNPFNYRVRSYFSDLLQEQPRLLQEALIEHTPLSLLDENVRRAPVYVEHRMNLADYLEKTGKQDEAYKMLVDEALPWANLRHARYQEHRLALYKRVRRAAIQRNDVLGLNKLLTAMSKTK